MGFFSSIGRGLRSIGSAVASAARKVVSVAKEYAGKALSYIADNGERFIEKVKETWARVSPILRSHIKPFLDKLEVIASTIPISWVKTAVVAMNRGLEALLALENSPVLKKLEKAILWATEKAKKYKDIFLNEEEMNDVAMQKEYLHEAASKLNDKDQIRAFNLAEMIHDFILARSAIKHIFDNDIVEDFDHFLRLRATQKLLNEAQTTIDRAESAEDISLDDIFLLQIAANLISTKPSLSEKNADRLELIVEQRFGKSLIAFVFEEMVMAWSNSLETSEQEWAAQNKGLAKDKTILRRLEQTIKLGGELDAEESILVKELNEVVPIGEKSLSDAADKILAKKKFIYASEGLLQVLEKSDNEMEDYIANGATKVGSLIVSFAQDDRSWSSLTEDEQSLINDYANIFETDSKLRAAKFVEVAV